MKKGVQVSNGDRITMRLLGLILVLAFLPWHLQARDHASMRSVDLQERLVALLARQGGEHWKGISPSALEQAMRVRWRRGEGLPSSGRGEGITVEGWSFWMQTEFRNGGYQTLLDTYVATPGNTCTFNADQFARRLRAIGMKGGPVRSTLLPETWYLGARNVEVAVRTYTSTTNGQRHQCVETISIGPREF
ncbi:MULTISPECIES: hypothetical protein [Stenotrophomonas]|uniref:hypothetical protein n=1 Tax=Stenotrophomonas TaxID=40323 RepID=UPI000D37E444|nr:MULTISPECIES: hypothetical protein [Stenotrophomonas]PTT41553.1 hypothetical protein DBR33_12875 [Stenotrophomonas sp. HMWF022]PTS78555.1 hypothetical protein DBR20_05915 [Stenotrophomonas sp. HMWF023]CAH0141672.1 hypothetical protein SRABI102_00314 [Stenotrophomonas lactitubi]CAH0157511.1 hypothetical protein SRABI122_00856 [Stenotrophomonas lactitubi]CAH0168752.1 hypothetical protein SRABI66_01149 [Stenotrophomonas lactitubi]